MGFRLVSTRVRTIAGSLRDPGTPGIPGISTSGYQSRIRYIDSLIVRFRDSNTNGTLDDTLYYTNDANYNVTALVDDEGDILERYEYTPYGKRLVLNDDFTNHANPTLGSYDNHRGHQGLAHDPLTGLIDNRNRIYHPTLGRFIQRDPLGYPDGMNTYAAYHIMHGGVDPMGLYDTYEEYVSYQESNGAPYSYEDYNNLREYRNQRDVETQERQAELKRHREELRAKELASGFWVVGYKNEPITVFQMISKTIPQLDREWWGKVLHRDIIYNGVQVRTGYYGSSAVGAARPMDTIGYAKKLKQKRGGVLEWGDCQGVECRFATDEMILSCISAIPEPNEEYCLPNGPHCQTDVAYVTSRCCLRGFIAIAGDFRESDYDRPPAPPPSPSDNSTNTSGAAGPGYRPPNSGGYIPYR